MLLLVEAATVLIQETLNYEQRMFQLGYQVHKAKTSRANPYLERYPETVQGLIEMSKGRLADVVDSPLLLLVAGCGKEQDAAQQPSVENEQAKETAPSVGTGTSLATPPTCFWSRGRLPRPSRSSRRLSSSSGEHRPLRTSYPG